MTTMARILPTQLPSLPLVPIHHKKYLRKVLFRACCKQSQVPEDCIKEVKPIFDCLLFSQIDKTQDQQLTIMGMWKLFKDHNLYIAITILTNLFKKACQCSNQFGRQQLDISSIHHMLHNQEVQRIYRKQTGSMLPTTINQLFQRLYESLERDQLLTKIKVDASPVKEQYLLYMRLMTVGQGSGQNSLPQLHTEKSEDGIHLSQDDYPLEFDDDCASDDFNLDEQSNFLGVLVDSAISRGKSLASEQILLTRTFHQPKQMPPDRPKKVMESVKILDKPPLPSYLKSFHEQMMMRMSKVSKDKNFGKLNYLVEKAQIKNFKLPQIN